MGGKVNHMENAIMLRTLVAGAISSATLAKGISLNELSKRSGIPYSTLYRKVKGKADFTLEELAEIGTALGVDWRDFLPTESQINAKTTHTGAGAA